MAMGLLGKRGGDAAACESKTAALSRVALFAGLDSTELARLARITEDLDFEVGRVLCREGMNAHEFFVIREGSADVTKDGELVRSLGPGDFFGGTALLEGEPRRTTVTAASPLRAFVLSSQAFRALVHANHEVERHALRELVAESVIERKIAEENLRRQAEINAYQALHDPLTGLPNRILFSDRVQQGLLTAERNTSRLAVVMMDLDRFKEVNDTLGHQAGDVLLQEIATRLRGALRAVDTVARLGGDEFGVVLAGGDRRDVLEVIERIRAAVEQPLLLHDLPVVVEGSIGVAFYPDHGRNVEALLQHADIAMYVAKQQHTGYAFFDTTIGGYNQERLRVVGELRRAIDDGELVLHYQPKADLTSGAVGSVEALVRWHHPERGLLGPDEFIPVAQETGLIRPLTLWVLERAISQCVAWRGEEIEVTMAVNVSARNLLDADFPGQVASLLAARSCEPSWLELEITESTVLADPFRTKRVLDELDAMGVTLTIDDFGVGYSSLAYLKSLPVRAIKIDRSFVGAMLENENDAVIVRSTIDLARDLGLEVVAEGVESEEAWQRLRTLGCDTAQGYHLSRPVPADELSDWLRDRPGEGGLAQRSVA